MAAEQSGLQTFHLFSSSEDKAQLPFPFSDSRQEALPPLPPCLEVLPSEVSSCRKRAEEPVILGGLTLLKGRVSTREVYALSNSDLVPGKYEGGLKLWEGSLDLVKTLSSEMEGGRLLLAGKRVLELGCGHGLPGIVACLKGAAVVHFQDFNAEVLQFLTIPNVRANVTKESWSKYAELSSSNVAEIRYFSGDWSEVHEILPNARTDEENPTCNSGPNPSGGYDIILMAETVYSISSLRGLYELIKKCLARPYGVVYMAAKKHYFGVGGGSRRFLSVVDKEGLMAADLVAEVADGSSNVREVWKLHFK